MQTKPVGPVVSYEPFWPRAIPTSRPTGPDPALFSDDLDGRLKRDTWNAAKAGALLAASQIVFRINNVPTEETVAAAIEWRPDAAPLLRRWKAIWDASFESGAKPFKDHKNESAGGTEKWNAETDRYLDKALAEGSILRAAIHRFRQLTRGMNALEDDWQRPWQAHVIDDADHVVALEKAVPGDAWLRVGGVLVALEGHRADGMPILAEVRSYSTPDGAAVRHLGKGRTGYDLIKHHTRQDDSVYWDSPAFARAAGRRFATTGSPQMTALVLAGMAAEGASKAFLKGVASKSGTWTVDLTDVTNPIDAIVAIYRAVMPSDLPRNLVVQDHVPFAREQRFFVVAGRIVASVCSDRNFCAMDGRLHRILDDRVAVLERPEIAEGLFDRGRTMHVVDRATSAAFARSARRLVAELAAEGLDDYVIDMGMTSDDGRILPIEINSLYMAGPYCLPASRLVAARNRVRERALSAVRSLVAEVMSHDLFGLDASLPKPHVVDKLMEGHPSCIQLLVELGGMIRDRSTNPPVERFMLDTMLVRHETYRVGRSFQGERWVALENLDRASMYAEDRLGFALLPGCRPLFSVPFTLRDPDDPARPKIDGVLTCSTVHVPGKEFRAPAFTATVDRNGSSEVFELKYGRNLQRSPTSKRLEEMFSVNARQAVCLLSDDVGRRLVLKESDDFGIRRLTATYLDQTGNETVHHWDLEPDESFGKIGKIDSV